MFVSGFTFIRNGIRYDYPFLESIRSALPLCDELIVMAGNSDDDTRRSLETIASDKLKIYDSVWDDSLREGGRVLAIETDKAMDRIAPQADWALYLQGDEVLHEASIPAIRQAMVDNLGRKDVEGLLFDYLHFYGSYRYTGDSRRWYRHEIRVIRNDPAIRSWRDAQGFRKNGRKLHVKPAGATVYHYGWVKSPAAQQQKQKAFHRLWHSDAGVQRRVGTSDAYDYSRIDSLRPFAGSHPAVMADRIGQAPETMNFDPQVKRFTLKERFLYVLEKWTGWRVGEYRNYRLV